MAHVWSGRAAVAAAFLAAAFSACQSKTVKVAQSEEQGPPLSSAVHTGDPKSETQLLSGFYAVEQGSWRWTGQRFAVLLRPPGGSGQKGATLNVQLAVPQVTIDKLKTITLSATAGGANGASLPPETYSQAGSFTFTRDVPAAQLAGDSVRIDFQCDKAIPPSGTDQRDLALIVSSVSLDAK